MQHTATTFAQVLADKMIMERFGRSYGITTLEAYHDHLEGSTTAHLAKGAAERTSATAGAQRRAAKLSIENASTVIIAIPLDNPRARGARLTQTVSTWPNTSGSDTITSCRQSTPSSKKAPMRVS
ncbi:MAG TPA: hypothetical protein PLH11_04175 [Gemmobacter sp.]|nr:hypothetical protein [Gemmobacter sp.]